MKYKLKNSQEYAFRNSRLIKEQGVPCFVKSTPIAIANGLFKKQKKGTVEGFGRDGTSVRVLVDNTRRLVRYWSGFWKPRISLDKLHSQTK